MKALVLIDGHNLLYAARARFAAALVDGHPGTAARAALAGFLAEVFAGADAAVRVYFDGGEAHVERRSGQVEVVYPGGEGDQRADQAILAALREHDARGGPEPVVVTRDLKLARRARKRGAVVVDPGKFLADCDAGLIP